MTRKLIFLAAAAALIQPTVVLAQSTPPALASFGLKCSDFQKNDDGTWSPSRTVTLPTGGARLSLSKKDIIGPSPVAGVPLGVMINRECTGH